MQRKQSPAERAVDLIRLLGGLKPDWYPTPYHYLWAIRIVLGVILIVLIVGWSWVVLVDYIRPGTPTERKDVANLLVLIAAGVVGSLTALAAVGNLYISRRNLQQQRELEVQRAQDDALQAYYEQIGKLLTEQQLPDQLKGSLARAQTLTVLDRIDAGRKGAVVRFLYSAGLLGTEKPVVDLRGANLRHVNLYATELKNSNFGGADLRKANLGRTILSSANLRNTEFRAANLSGANLVGADLSGARFNDAALVGADLVRANLNRAQLIGADLTDANFSGANLSGANFSGANLRNATITAEGPPTGPSLQDTIMPHGSKRP